MHQIINALLLTLFSLGLSTTALVSVFSKRSSFRFKLGWFIVSLVPVLGPLAYFLCANPPGVQPPYLRANCIYHTDPASKTAIEAQTQELNDRYHVRKAPFEFRRNDPCPCGSGKKYKRCCLQ